MILRHIYLSILGFCIATTGCSNEPSPRSGSTVRAECLGIDIPVETEISVAGVYRGGAHPEGQVISSSAPTLVELAANAEGLPQIYVVSAETSVVWDFAAIPPQRVIGIIAYGEKRQMIRNAPPNVTVAHGHHEAHDGQEEVSATAPECAGYYSPRHGGPVLEALVAEVEKGTGAKVKRFRGAYEPTLLNFDADQPGEEALVPSLRPARNPRDSIDDAGEWTDDYPGSEWIRPLVTKGLLRKATAADVRAWEEAATAKLARPDLAPYRSINLGLRMTYVVLGPISLPESNSGTFSRQFIVPKDVPSPNGPSGFHKIYRMATGTCDAAPDC
jgi:hypothetical protein